MEEARKVAREVDARLRRGSSAARRAQNETYFPSAMEILGVSTKGIREVVRDLRKKTAGRHPRDVVDTALALIVTNTLEGRQVAYELLSRHRGAMESLNVRDVKALGRGMDNWASVDTFSVLVAGPSWREGRIPDREIRAWTRSRDRWWRRAAVVSTVALNLKSRGGRGDVRRTLDICARVASDRDDMVAKALSWALRELSKREKSQVRQFLAEHGNVLPARVLREVNRKLETGRKV